MRKSPSGRGSARVAGLSLAAGALSWSQAAAGHGFGQRYDLPLPLWLYLIGAAAAVALSFLVMAVFARRTLHGTYPRVNLLSWPGVRLLAHPAVLTAVRLLAMAMFLLVVTAGLIGAQNPFKNIAPIMVWAVWWVGMAYVCALLGNLWALIHPANSAFVWMESLYRRVRRQGVPAPRLRFPSWLGIWPATALFFVFAWGELIWDHADSPIHLSAALLLYCVLTWAGMLCFGRVAWLRQADVFSALFGVLSRFSPTEVRVLNPPRCAACQEADRATDDECVDGYACFAHGASGQRQWNLRPYAAGLLTARPVHVSMMTLALMMLATVSFDGFIETPAWAALVERLQAAGPGDQEHRRAAIYTLGLAGAVGVFYCVYLLFSWLIARGSVVYDPKRQRPPARYSASAIARHFVLTLVPIAIAYHVAHYLSFLAMASQYLIPLASDPFGFGWNLLGTAYHFVRPGVIGARMVWYVSVAAIVAGHIAAVVLAHVTAARLFEDRRAAIRSQYPMLILMLGYTMLSLWIIAQPITTTR